MIDHLFKAPWFKPFRWLLSLIYGVLVWLRNSAYDTGLFKSTKVKTTVIAVGNLTVGGSGKTVLVETLITTLKQLDKTVAVCSRGYGRRSRGLLPVSNGERLLTTSADGGDEPFMIATNHPDVPVVVSENRLQGCRYLEDRFRPDVILLDDAFQHRQLARDINILIVDFPHSEKQYLLPRGRLREPISSSRRADIVIYSKQAAGHNLPFDLRYAPQDHVVDAKGKTQPFSELAKPVGAFSGLGNNSHFFSSLRTLVPHLKSTLSFPDHCRYDAQEQHRIAHSDCASWITTQKDFVKLTPEFCRTRQVYFLPLKGIIPQGLMEHLKQYFN